MKVVRETELEYESRAPRGREGRSRSAVIMVGDAARPDNFVLRFAELNDFYSPRHRHNFDQYYYMMDGEADFGAAGVLTKGSLAYVPAGTYYGPQSGTGFTVLSLQFGGPCGLGFLGFDQTTKAYEELKRQGRFERGVYHRFDGVEGPRAQDSYEAIWEWVRKRPVIYPESPSKTPIVMCPDNVSWAEDEASPEVQVRALGTFSDFRFAAVQLRASAGKSLTLKGRGVFMLLSGAALIDQDVYGPLTCLELEDDEQITLEIREETEVMQLGLPAVKSFSTELTMPQ